MTELRGLAQSMGCKWTFSDDRNILTQKISLKQNDLMPPPKPIVVPQPEDQRLRTKPPSKISDEDMIRTMLRPYTEIGLDLKFEHGMFHMKHNDKTDSGTLRQPPRTIIDCARRIMS